MILRADPRCLSTLVCFLLLACFVPAPAIAQRNPLAPSPETTAAKTTVYYEGDGLILSMEPVDTGAGAVQGRIRMGDDTFPYRATYSSNTSLEGTFTANGAEFSFTATKDGKALRLETDGASYAMNEVERPSSPFPNEGESAETQESSASAEDLLTGTWQGTGKDEAEDGTPVEFPVTITILRSPDGSLAADFHSTVPYPVGAGQTVPVEIVGRFTGEATGNPVIELKAPDMTATAQGQSESLGAQTMRLQAGGGGRMSGTLGNDLEGWAPFAVQRKEEPKRSGSTGVPRSAPEGTIVLEKVTLRDPGMNGMESHTLLKPKGWEIKGGLQWNPRAFRDFVHMNLRVSASDGRELAIYPGGFYEDSDVYEVMRQLGGVAQRPQPGTVTTSGIVHMPLPESPADYVTDLVIPTNRPQARNVRVLSRTPLPELARQLQTTMEPALRNAQRNDAQLRQLGAMVETSMSMWAERVRIAYQERGQDFEEDVWVMGTIQRRRQQMQGMPLIQEVKWIMIDPRGVRAPAAELERARPVIEAISLSLRQNPRHAAVLMDLRHKINMQQLNALAKVGKITRQGQQEAWDIYQFGVREQQASNDRTREKFVDYLRDVDDYQDVGGSEVKLPSLYSYVYSNGKGAYILSNEPTFNPDDHTTDRWERIDPAR